MPRSDYKTCKHCSKHASEVGPLSNTRLCLGCAIEREEANNFGIAEHRGPWFQNWRRRGAAGYGAVLLDDVLANAQTADDAR